MEYLTKRRLAIIAATAAVFVVLAWLWI